MENVGKLQISPDKVSVKISEEIIISMKQMVSDITAMHHYRGTVNRGYLGHGGYLG